MKAIRCKQHAKELLDSFEEVASYDHTGAKHYFVFRDANRKGQWTLMKTNHQWSIHGKGDMYSDKGETVLNEKEVIAFLWKERKYVNEQLKQLVVH